MSPKKKDDDDPEEAAFEGISPVSDDEDDVPEVDIEIDTEIDADALAFEDDDVDLGGDDDDSEDDDSDDDGAEEEDDGIEGAAKAPKKAAKPKKGEEDEDEEPLLPDTPVPTKAKMIKALEWAFEGESDITPELLEQFADHALLLLKTNRTLNLTAIIDPKEVAAKHYLDSWRISRLVPLVARRIVDLGSGGGFPGLPVAISEPMCSLVLTESKKKKAAFLEEAVQLLGLRNVSVVGERCEDFLTKERCDVVLVRAVSSVRENVRTLRRVRHALKDYVMLKGKSWSREVRAAEREAERLGFKLDTVWEHSLPEEMGQRAILVYRAPGGAGM